MKILLPGTQRAYTVIGFLLLSLFSSAQGVYRFWGVTHQGGDDNTGVLFNIDSNGNNYTKRHDFKLNNPGAAPYYTQLAEYNGKFYGMTIAGGDNNGYGVIFEWDPSENTYTKKHDFAVDDAWFGYGSLTLCNNKFYGMTSRGGTSGSGIIFEWDPATNAFTHKINLDDNTGHSPEGSLTEKNGKLYGMTKYGGSDFSGTIFEYDPATNIFTKKVDFNGSNGRSPGADLTWYDGSFYGMTGSGGDNEYGTIFEWTPSTNTFTKKIDLDGDNGKYPYGSLTKKGTNLYGMTSEGGTAGSGVLFEWNPANNVYTKKQDFTGANGSYPYGNLTLANGKLAGMTWMGGPDNFGILFEWDPVSNTFTQQVEFNNAGNGANPFGSLTWMGNRFCGVTTKGGSANGGTIFEWDAVTNTFTKKIDMNIASDGANPEGKLIMLKGNIYGVAKVGGVNNKGLLFEYNQHTQVFTKKIELAGTDGAFPNGDLLMVGEKVYGTTKEGGANNAGVIFEWDPNTNTYTKKFDFDYSTGGTPNDGQLLYNGKIYGTTNSGGDNGNGVIYEFDPATSAYTKKYDFGTSDGSYPNGYLVMRAGKIYGMTRYGGANETGVIFEWNPATNVYAKKYDFATDITGVHPRAGLTLSVNGNMFYGTTRETRSNISFPGQEGPGVIFQWDPVNNVYTKKIDFDGDNGGLPIGNLTESGGKYYGMTSQGGNGPSYPGINIIVGGSGVVFEWDPVTNICVKKADLTGANGAYPSQNDLSRMPVAVADGNAASCASFPNIVINASNNNKWVPIVDGSGNVVAEIRANGNNLGTVTTQAYINNAAVREDGVKKLYLDRSLTITPQVQPATGVDVRLYIKEGEYNALKLAQNSSGQPSGITAIGDLAIFKDTEPCASAVALIKNQQATVANGWSNDYVLSTTITSFSSFYFARNANATAPLPLQLLSFTGKRVNNDGLLEWETSSETNTLSFEVERSTDGVGYATIGLVNAQNTPGKHAYTFKDQNISNLGSKKVYYRLHQKDIDGGNTYSRFVVLTIDDPNAIVLYPNPVKTQASLLITFDRMTKAQLRILDNMGRVLRVQQLNLPAGTTTHPVDFGSLPAGTYFVDIQGALIHQQIKVLKN